MTDNVDFSRSFRRAAWALARVCCVGLLFLGTTNCLPAPSDDSGNGGATYSAGGEMGSGGMMASGGFPAGGSTHVYGGATYTSNGGATYTSNGGATYTSNGGATYTSNGGMTSSPNGGATTTTNGGATTTANGGATTTTIPTAGTTSVTPTAGTTSATPTGTTVTFASGKAAGAMTGYGWVALGSADTVTDPTCGPSKAAITSAAPCATSTNWSTTTGLCITGSIPALGTPPDYTGNWGVSVGVNAGPAAGTGLGQSFASITIAVAGSPATGLRAMVHRSGDPDATSYCYALTPGTAIPLTSFSTTCYNTATPGTALTAADVPKIDKVSVQVSSGAAAISVASLCINGITFAN